MSKHHAGPPGPLKPRPIPIEIPKSYGLEKIREPPFHTHTYTHSFLFAKPPPHHILLVDSPIRFYWYPLEQFYIMLRARLTLVSSVGPCFLIFKWSVNVYHLDRVLDLAHLLTD